jgi:secreted trypsin-like serine protease
MKPSESYGKNRFSTWIAIFVTSSCLNACNGNPLFKESQSAKSPESQSNQKNRASADDDVCLFVRSGTELNVDQKKQFGGVGLLALVDNAGAVQGICTGMLIRPDVVLTAQHCVADENQVPYQPSQLVYTLEPSNASVRRAVKSVIQWAEKTTPPSVYRDVALVVLDKPFDESFPIFDIKQTLAEAGNGISDLTMVGFGGYTDGGNAATYSVGTRRFGLAKFNGIAQNIPFPDYANVNYLGNGDYISLLPGTTGQIICGGDSGSSLFWNNGFSRQIVGVTSMGAASGTTAADQCASTAEGLFVPSHQIRNWVSAKLGEIKPGDKLESYSLIEATLKSKVDSATGSDIELSEIKYLDNGIGITGTELKTQICSKDCKLLTEVTGELSLNSKYVIKMIKDGEVNKVAKIGPRNIPSIYPLEFNASIRKIMPEVDVFGRKEKEIQFENIKIPEAGNAIPVRGDFATAVICSSGCSVASSIATVGFEPQLSKGVTVKAEYIEGFGIYVREIKANAAFNKSAIEQPLPSETDDAEDEEPVIKKKKSKKSKC